MIRARLHPFDSDKLAPRVGYVILEDAARMGDAEAIELIESAADDRFDFVWLQAPAPLVTTLFDHRGTLIDLDGNTANVLEQARLADFRFDVRTLTSRADWEALDRLLRVAAAPTRFSADPGISEEAVRRHKIAMLKNQVERHQGAVVLAYVPETGLRPIGYHCASIEDGCVRLYEIAVDPNFRRGFAALNLVRYNLERVAAAHPGAQRAVTRVYEDNVSSLRLFRKLGFRPAGASLYYYHCWPMRQREELRERANPSRH